MDYILNTTTGALRLSQHAQPDQDPVSRLRNALSSNQILLYGQPIIDLAHDAQASFAAECLVRFQEEEAALMYPGAFLPVFERHNMMPELDRWVIGRAIMYLVHHCRIQRMTLNVASQSLVDPGFTEFVADAINASDIQPASLVFELEERALAETPRLAARFCAIVRAIGCGVLVEGVGGQDITAEPFKAVQRGDLLKIDGSVVRNVLRSAEARDKLAAIVQLAQTLGCEVIGAMVEQVDVLAMLKAAGVRYAQGQGVCEPRLMDVLMRGAEENHAR